LGGHVVKSLKLQEEDRKKHLVYCCMWQQSVTGGGSQIASSHRAGEQKKPREDPTVRSRGDQPKREKCWRQRSRPNGSRERRSQKRGSGNNASAIHSRIIPSLAVANSRLIETAEDHRHKNLLTAWWKPTGKGPAREAVLDKTLKDGIKGGESDKQRIGLEGRSGKEHPRISQRKGDLQTWAWGKKGVTARDAKRSLVKKKGKKKKTVGLTEAVEPSPQARSNLQ